MTQSSSNAPRDIAAEGFPVTFTEYSGATPAADGWHDAVIAEIVDLGMDFSYNKIKGDHRGLFIIQLDELVEEGPFEGQRKEARLFISFDQGLGSSEKGNELRRRLEDWRDAKFTPAEIERIKTVKPLKLADLVGKPLRVMTATTEAKKSDRMYAKVIKFGPANADKSLRLSISDNYVPFHDRKKEQDGAAASAHQNARGNAQPEPWDGGSVGDGAPADDDGPGF